MHEPFRALPCPKQPVSTLDQEGCTERALLRSDAKVNLLAARIWHVLPAAGRPAFARGEHSWMAYRVASCRAESSEYTGGTLQPVAYLGCEVARNTAHLSDLTGTLRALTHP